LRGVGKIGRNGEKGMREILFRGKRVDNGEWVEGNLVCLKNLEDQPYQCFIISQLSYLEYGEFDEMYQVFPEMVGQFTGMTDKNGKRIFEGDIVRNEKHYYDGVVCFDRIGNDGGIGLNGYFIKEIDIYGEFDEKKTDYDTKEKFYECNRCIDLKQLAVIGNIHDNGELLTAERSE
jgi:uncharacterized phage protein (TIGR01671 family)